MHVTVCLWGDLTGNPSSSIFGGKHLTRWWLTKIHHTCKRNFSPNNPSMFFTWMLYLCFLRHESLLFLKYALDIGLTIIESFQLHILHEIRCKLLPKTTFLPYQTTFNLCVCSQTIDELLNSSYYSDFKKKPHNALLSVISPKFKSFKCWYRMIATWQQQRSWNWLFLLLFYVAKPIRKLFSQISNK